MGSSYTASDEGASEPEVLVWPDDPRTWDIVGDPKEALRIHRTFRTYLVRWHRWTCDWEQISHFEDYTDVHLDERLILRAFGRIIYSNGEDVTAEYVRSSS
jgi:hypothetical protein